jgi:serine/threonine-protein kinase
VSTGHIVYAVEDGSLRAVRFDPKTVAVSGNPVPVLDAVGVKISGAASFELSSEGRLVYVTVGAGNGNRTLAWVDMAGHETPIAAPTRNYYYARVSPDGKRLSLDVRDQEQDVWIWDLARETMARLTDTPGADQYGLWTRDGGHVVFSSAITGRQEIFWHRPDGVGKPEPLTDTVADKLVPYPNAITPDGKQIIARAAAGGGKNDLFVVPVGGDRKLHKLLASEHDEKNAALAPDGRFMAFESDLSGRNEVYVRPFPDVDRRQWPVSTGGGAKPVWAPDGRQLYYLATDGKMMAVSADLASDLGLGKPVALFDAAPYFMGSAGRNFDVAPDGKRFVLVKNPVSTSGNSAPVTVVLNWVDELKARLK